MIADEPTRLTRVGDSLGQQRRQHELQQDEEGERQPDQRREPAQPGDQPHDDGEDDRQHHHRRVALVVVEAVGRPALGAGVAGEDEHVALLDAVRDDVGRQVDLHEVARPLAVEDLHDRGGAAGRTAGSVPQSKASTETTRASGYSVPGRQLDLGRLLRRGRLVGRPEHEQAERVARPTGTRSSSISQTARRRRRRASGLGGGASGSGPWLWA